MNYKILSEINPSRFIQDFVETIKTTDYRFIYEKSTIITYPLCEAILYENPDYKPLLFDVESVPANAIIDRNGWNVFLSALQDFVLSGWEPDISTFTWDVVLGRITLVAKNPLHPSLIKYTKEELDEMQWEELKYIGRCHGITGRDRRILTNNIMKSILEEIK